MKYKQSLLLTLSLTALLISCQNPSDSSSDVNSSIVEDSFSTQSEKPEQSSTNEDSSFDNSSNEEGKDYSKATTIYLAGDSTVKTYDDSQYIGGWGQYLDLFLNENVKVVNAANGGRSSRSFINEGRLYNIDDEKFSYSFSQNGGNSIEDVIKEGDFLFIQFGHNDDASKMTSSYATIFDRMVPLGTPDENGIYPIVAAEKTSTETLPSEFTNLASDSEEKSALTEIKKYGSSYYAYGSGTYKWYLKQYIDFARSKNATPVLITPVARVKFSGESIVGGPGLHGENFAYVNAVRQLAQEENCLLIDLFDDSKNILEVAGPSYANYLMALKPNDLKGTWPKGYDKAYGNTELGYTGIEATHYNKYGAFLQAGKIAEQILNNNQETSEYFSFKDFVLSSPESYIDPSNLMSKSVVSAVENLFESISVTNPNRDYNDPLLVVNAIDELSGLGDMNNDNYMTFKEKCEEVEEMYYSLNIDDRNQVTNYETLQSLIKQVEEFESLNRPKPVKTDTYVFDSYIGTYTENIVTDDFTIFATSAKNVEIKSNSVNAQYNGETYTATSYLKLGGTGSFNSYRGISFDVSGKCVVTILSKSSGSTARTLSISNSSGKSVGTYNADTSATFSSVEIQEGGSYFVMSTGSGIYIYMIIIEYFE